MLRGNERTCGHTLRCRGAISLRGLRGRHFPGRLFQRYGRLILAGAEGRHLRSSFHHRGWQQRLLGGRGARAFSQIELPLQLSGGRRRKHLYRGHEQQGDPQDRHVRDHHHGHDAVRDPAGRGWRWTGRGTFISRTGEPPGACSRSPPAGRRSPWPTWSARTSWRSTATTTFISTTTAPARCIKSTPAGSSQSWPAQGASATRAMGVRPRRPRSACCGGWRLTGRGTSTSRTTPTMSYGKYPPACLKGAARFAPPHPFATRPLPPPPRHTPRLPPQPALPLQRPRTRERGLPALPRP